jgi:ornithine cyclodeaminase/alanine dehydrogenase-like protein (mu-crystallin family)
VNPLLMLALPLPFLAGLILELFPAVTTTTFIVRSITSRSAALVDRVKTEFGDKGVQVEAVTAEETAEKVREADIICTYALSSCPAKLTLRSLRANADDERRHSCVPSTTPLFEEKDLKENVHINASASSFFHLSPPSTPCSSALGQY